jgi:hypothetical protein
MLVLSWAQINGWLNFAQPFIYENRSQRGATPMKMSRRGFLVSSGAALAVRSVPQVAGKASGRRILTLVYDKALGMMRAVERVVN